MHVRTSIVLTLVLAIATTPTALVAQNARQRFTVVVTVACDDAMLRDQFRSYVTRELREVNDVDVADTPPSRGAVFGIVISGLRIVTAAGLPNGWAASWVVTQRVYEPNDALTAIRGVNSIYVNSGVFVGADSDLKNSMQKAVASFDASTLEELRSLSRP